MGNIYHLLITSQWLAIPGSEFKHYLFKNDWFMKTLDPDEFYKLAVIELQVAIFRIHCTFITTFLSW